MNDKYDEAVDVSQSIDQGAKMEPEEKKGSSDDTMPNRASNMSALPEEKTNSFMNKPFDEALEFSQSNSDESVDTRGSGGKSKMNSKVEAKSSAPSQSNTASSENYFQPKTQNPAVSIYVLI